MLGGQAVLVTETIEPMALKETEGKDMARAMVAQARRTGVGVVDPDGLLAGLTMKVLELALESELTEHLGYEAGDREAKAGTNERNGTRSRTVITEIGPVQLEVPRDREGTFEAAIVKKR